MARRISAVAESADAWGISWWCNLYDPGATLKQFNIMLYAYVQYVGNELRYYIKHSL